MVNGKSSLSSSAISFSGVNLTNRMLLVVAANKKPVHHNEVYTLVYGIDASTQSSTEIGDKVSLLRHLKKQGLVETTKPATYKITASGREVVKMLKKKK